MIQTDVLQFLIEKGPGRTAGELAVAIHGVDGVQNHNSHVNDDCQRLARSGAVKQSGAGASGDPYRYYPAG